MEALYSARVILTVSVVAGVTVRVGVRVNVAGARGVAVGVNVAGEMGVEVGVRVRVAETIGVAVGVRVKVGETTEVALGVRVKVGLPAGVEVDVDELLVVTVVTWLAELLPLFGSNSCPETKASLSKLPVACGIVATKVTRALAPAPI